MEEQRHYCFDLEHDELCMVDWYKFRTAAKVDLKAGNPLARIWPKDGRISVDPDSDVKKPGDILGNSDDVMIVAGRVKEIMERFAGPTLVEFLPIAVCDKKGKALGDPYFVVNPLMVYDAMDLGASKLSWDSEGNLYRIDNIVLKKEMIAQLPSLCRLTPVPGKVIMNYPLALALNKQKCLLPWERLVYNDAPHIEAWRAQTGIPAHATCQQLSATHQLIEAVKENKKAKVIKLLAQHPFLDAFDRHDRGATALMHAAQLGYVEMIRLLVEKGSSLNRRNEEGMTALFMAVQEDKVPSVKALLEAGADPNLPRIKVNEPNLAIGTPLAQAVFRKCSTITALLLQYNADPNLADHNGKIPFHDAAEESTFQLLLDAGTHPNAQSPYFSTPFHIVARAGSVDLLEAMLQKGGMVDSIDSYSQWTPLMAAAAGGNTGNVRFLLGRGARIDAKDKKGMTAVQHAFNNKHFEAVALLVEKGAVADKQMLQRIEKLGKHRRELAFDRYALEMAAYIAALVEKNKKKIKFSPEHLQVNLDKEGALEFFVLTGKTQQQQFTYEADANAVDAPTGYKEGNIAQLLAAFQEKYRLKAKTFSVHSLLCWQLHKQLAAILPKLGNGPLSLLLVVDRYEDHEKVSVTEKRVLAAFHQLATKAGFLHDLAAVCLASPAEQQQLMKLFEAPSTTYAMEEISTSLASAAVGTVLKHCTAFRHPVKKIKLLFRDFGSLLPSYIELSFTKGRSLYWPIEVPGSPLPDHIDEIHNEDLLLPGFVEKYKAKGLEWGDFYQLPHALLRMELLMAAQSVASQLKAQQVQLHEAVSVCIGDGEDDSEELNDYIGLVQKELRKKMKDTKLLKAFAALCYSSEEKQVWLQQLADGSLDRS